MHDNLLADDQNRRATPVPISNTEVKPSGDLGCTVREHGNSRALSAISYMPRSSSGLGCKTDALACHACDAGSLQRLAISNPALGAYFSLQDVYER